MSGFLCSVLFLRSGYTERSRGLCILCLVFHFERIPLQCFQSILLLMGIWVVSNLRLLQIHGYGHSCSYPLVDIYALASVEYIPRRGIGTLGSCVLIFS